MHQQYVSVICMATWGRGRVVAIHPSTNHPSIMHLKKGYQAEPSLKHSGKKKKKEKQSMLAEGEVVKQCAECK